MKIVKCEKCGRVIHKAEKCFHCGNSLDFFPIDNTMNIHENVRDEYMQINDLIISKKWSEVLELSKKILEWMPDCAEIFWIRVLSRNNCINDIELVSKGFNFEENPDFHNAMRYANSLEKKVYCDVREKIISIQKVLTVAVQEHEYQLKIGTNICDLQKDMHIEINNSKQRLFELWSKLEEIEQKIYELELDCKLLTHEYEETLDSAKNLAVLLKTEVYKLSECTDDKFHLYLIQLGSVLQQSEDTKRSLDDMKLKHPWVKTFNDLLKNRDEIIDQISKVISDLKLYESKVVRTVISIENIENRHKEVIQAINKNKFMDALTLLGEKQYKKLLVQAGLVTVGNYVNNSVFGQKLDGFSGEFAIDHVYEYSDKR